LIVHWERNGNFDMHICVRRKINIFTVHSPSVGHNKSEQS